MMNQNIRTVLFSSVLFFLSGCDAFVTPIVGQVNVVSPFLVRGEDASLWFKKGAHEVKFGFGRGVNPFDSAIYARLGYKSETYSFKIPQNLFIGKDKSGKIISLNQFELSQKAINQDFSIKGSRQKVLSRSRTYKETEECHYAGMCMTSGLSADDGLTDSYGYSTECKGVQTTTYRENDYFFNYTINFISPQGPSLGQFKGRGGKQSEVIVASKTACKAPVKSEGLDSH
jgi:hypothetical protein